MSSPIRSRRAWAGLSFAFATAAVAQESGEALTLDTVKVEAERERATDPVVGYTARRSASGTKTDTSLLETPQSISVVGREQMEAQQAQSIVEATRYTPGVRSETFGGDSRNDWFLVRGFTAQESGYYLDGLQLPAGSFATWRLEPFGMERIEAVRGPSSVLFGGTNPGGLLNLVSKKPPTEAVRHVELGVNEYVNGYGAVDLGGPIGQGGQWFYRVTALARGGNTQVRYTDNNRLFLAPSLTWKPTERTSLTLHGSYLIDRTRGQNFLPYEGTVVDAPYGRIPTDLFTSDPSLDRFKRDQGLVGYEFEHRFDDTWTVRQNLRYGRLAIDFKNLYGVGHAGPADEAQLARGNFVTTPKVGLFTLDNQAELRLSTGPVRHTVLVGLDYKHYALDDEQGYEAGAPLDLLDPTYATYAPTRARYAVNAIRQNQLGVYAQDQLRFLERLHLVLSGRHDWVGLSLDNALTPASSYDGGQRAFSGRAGLLYAFDSGFAPYVSYSRSFNPVAGTTAEGALFEPERGTQLEAGVKFQPEDTRLVLGLSVFELRRENFLTTEGFVQRQIGEVRSRGVEFEANASLAQGLDLVGSASYYQLAITQGVELEQGKRPTGVPEFLSSLWLDYTQPDGVLKGLGVGAGVRYVGQSFVDRANTLSVPGYVLVDAGVHYEREHWRAALNASNLLDATYVSSCSSEVACFYGDRRRAMLNVGYTW
ncbi:Ferrichrome-iron receptor [Cystobacter fuscus DSM 2262]|uniref:Ferrichrome-iron receptor n=1 Tax=Cystobacter fuscus (strain ATCC 25194 / DSM 2262 / NBRC 100088 / M29) TaxID=1242864 RepID=S9P4H7_CYSF2|nr:TonB-dependent siderophore receptor [Cystobacter fuscus]EPX59390.1 Ferrichrome-iron receptor [Cystobacter fuscus DSM 2262]